MAQARGASQDQHRRRVGRPRLRPASNAGAAPREEILDAAAELFALQGLAATTTRQIADRVGIRQASLYYYFAGKDDILLELLTQSVRPSLQVAATLESRCSGDPANGLYALALIDVATLVGAPHNIATLYLMPEVQGEEYASFRAERAELQSVYGRLGRAAASAATGAGLDEVLTAALIMQVVESVIQMRRSGIWRDDYAHEIAASCLRLIGLDSDAVARARVGAPSLLNDVLGDLWSRARRRDAYFPQRDFRTRLGRGAGDRSARPGRILVSVASRRAMPLTSARNLPPWPRAALWIRSRRRETACLIRADTRLPTA